MNLFYTMEKRRSAKFLFTIANEIKRSFETPVIFLTEKDYADDIYKLLMNMRKAIFDGASRERIADIVVAFHRDWLQAVRDLRSFHKRLKSISREDIIRSIEYTIKCIKQRSGYFQKYIHTVQKSLSNDQRFRIQTDIEIIDDMHEFISNLLKNKLQCFTLHCDRTEFEIKVEHEIEELMNWLDRLNDNLAIQFCDAIDLVPDLLTALLNASKLLFNKVTQETEDLRKSCVSLHDLEIKKLAEKIAVLTERIQRLQDGSSAAVMALRNKKLYLVDRLKMLEKWATKQKKLANEESLTSTTSNDKQKDKIENVHMFDHRLSGAERFHLVEGLVSLWKTAIHRSGIMQSTISILSCVNSVKEAYSDNLGKFMLDIHGRKIYEAADGSHLFQANQSGLLVPVDDDEHVYFYDDCGRYYLGPDGNRRIYKAKGRTSEYVIEITGEMYKYKEVEDGIDYYYNNIGRYYINENGEQIYKNSGSKSEFMSDGFGNLVRIHSKEFLPYDCPEAPVVTSDDNYLKITVGMALKKCLAEVVLHQPTDPIRFLADALEAYRINMVIKERRRNYEKKFMELRKIIKDEAQKAAEAVAAMKTDVSSCSEATTFDFNFMHYETPTSQNSERNEIKKS